VAPPRFSEGVETAGYCVLRRQVTVNSRYFNIIRRIYVVKDSHYCGKMPPADHRVTEHFVITIPERGKGPKARIDVITYKLSYDKVSDSVI
jgi:hypothetical protein